MGNAAYVTATHIVTALDDHSIELLVPVGLDTCHDNHQGEHFTQSAFTIDWQAKKVTCPRGKVSASRTDQCKSSGAPISRGHPASGPREFPVCDKCTRAASTSGSPALRSASAKPHI
ncbi:hypothetical protein [Streptomyces sp. NPDC002403]